jgi:hypothetical protein
VIVILLLEVSDTFNEVADVLNVKVVPASAVFMALAKAVMSVAAVYTPSLTVAV